MKTMCTALFPALMVLAASADVAVGFGARRILEVNGGTTQANRVFLGDRSILYKTGDGTVEVPGGALKASTDARITVLEGDFSVTGGETGNLSEPPPVCNRAAFWVDQTNILTTNGVVESEGQTASAHVTKWCDRRELDTANPACLYALPKWFGNDAHPALSNGVPPVTATFDGRTGVFFGGASSGQYLRWNSKGAEINLASVHHLFIVHAVTNWVGHPVGAEDYGRTGPFLTTVGATTPAYSGSAAMFVNRGDVCTPQMSARFLLDGQKWDGRYAPPKNGWQLLECDYYDILPNANNFYRSGFAETLKGCQGGDYLGEVLVFTNKLSDAERVEIERYLLEKWNLPDQKGLAPRTPGTEFSLAAGASVSVPASSGVTPPISFAGAGTVTKSGAGVLALGPTDKMEFGGEFVWEAGSVRLQGGRIPPLTVASGEKYAFSRYDGGSSSPTKVGDAASGITCAKTSDAGAGVVQTTGNGWLRVHTVSNNVKRLKVGIGTANLGSVLQLEGRVRGTGAPEGGDARAVFLNPDLEMPATITDATFDRCAISSGKTVNGWTARDGVAYILCTQAPQPNAAGKNTWSQWLDRSRTPPRGTNVLQLVQKAAASTTVSVPKAGLYELSFDAKGRYTSFDNKSYNKGYCHSDQQQQLDVLFGQNWATVARVGTLQSGCLHFNRFRFQFMIPEAGNWELGLRSPDSAWDGCVFLDNFSLIRVAEVSRETVHPIPNGSFDRLVRPASGQGSPENPYFRGCFTVFNVPENWSFAVNPQALYGYALTNGVIGAVTSGTDAWKSSFMQMFPFAEAPLGAGALAFVSTGAVASTTFTVPAGTWRLRGKLQRWATYWAPDRAGDKGLQGTPNVRATLTRNGNSIDLGSVKASTQELLTKVWPNTFTVPADEEVTLSLEQSVASAFVLLDDLELVREDTYEPDNLIADSGFETWAGYWSDYWVPGRKTAYGVAGSVPHSDRPQYWGYSVYEGNARLRLQNAKGAVQTLTIPTNGLYRFKMHIRARADGSGYANNPVRVWIAQGNVTNTAAITPTLFSRNWMEVSYLMNVPFTGSCKLGIEGLCRDELIERENSDSTKRADIDAHIDCVSLVPCRDEMDAAPTLPSGLRIDVAKGAQLLLDYTGTATCGPVSYDGHVHVGTLDAETHPEFVTGMGTLEARATGTLLVIR